MAGIVTFKDDFTVNLVSNFIYNLKEVIKNNEEVVIELTDVEIIDAAAIQILVAAKKECENIGRRVTFRIPDTVASNLSSIGIEL